jgi:Suppressor of fused protein (SUFU)
VAERRREQVRNSLRAHVLAFFAGRRVDEFSLDDLPFDTTPLRQTIPALRLLRVAPSQDESCVYTSLGLWEATASERDRHGLLEFVLGARTDSPDHLQLLAMTASYHADPAQRLGLGHTLPIGRPWTRGANCDHLLVSRPYPWGRALEVCALDGDHAHFLSLLPITSAEQEFKVERDVRGEDGLEALEQLFDTAAIEWRRPDRPSVV